MQSIDNMALGDFSLSLHVKNIEKSEKFYHALGFKSIDGGHMHEVFKDTDEVKWRVLAHESVKIGLFQGMFDENMMTFNPVNVEKIQDHLIKNDIYIDKKMSPNDSQKFILLTDPDGNTIMFDQK